RLNAIRFTGANCTGRAYLDMQFAVGTGAALASGYEAVVGPDGQLYTVMASGQSAPLQSVQDLDVANKFQLRCRNFSSNGADLLELAAAATKLPAIDWTRFHVEEK